LLGRYEQLFAVFAIAATLLHPGITLLLALNVNFPFTLGVAVIAFAVLKVKLPPPIEVVSEAKVLYLTITTPCAPVAPFASEPHWPSPPVPYPGVEELNVQLATPYAPPPFPYSTLLPVMLEVNPIPLVL
jgi:hypothetical protein